MAGYTEQRLIPFPSFLFPYFFEQWSSLHLFSFHEMLFPYLLLLLLLLSLLLDNHISRTTQATAMISGILYVMGSGNGTMNVVIAC